jgi:hypothetical protein
MMIKLKKLLKESSPGFENRQWGDKLPTLSDISARHQKKEDVLTESFSTVPDIKIDKDPDKTEKSFVKTFKELAKGHGNVIDYGPRETDIYDWNDRKNYESAIKEYNKWMQSIADRLNNAVGDMEIIFKVWGDISDKHRKKDRS